MKGVNEEYSRLIGEKDAHITKSEAAIRQSEGEIQRLRDSVTRYGSNPPLPPFTSDILAVSVSYKRVTKILVKLMFFNGD